MKRIYNWISIEDKLPDFMEGDNMRSDIVMTQAVDTIENDGEIIEEKAYLYGHNFRNWTTQHGYAMPPGIKIIRWAAID
jgi:hypothetical protein